MEGPKVRRKDRRAPRAVEPCVEMIGAVWARNMTCDGPREGLATAKVLIMVAIRQVTDDCSPVVPFRIVIEIERDRRLRRVLSEHPVLQVERQ